MVFNKVLVEAKGDNKNIMSSNKLLFQLMSTKLVESFNRARYKVSGSIMNSDDKLMSTVKFRTTTTGCLPWSRG